MRKTNTASVASVIAAIFAFTLTAPIAGTAAGAQELPVVAVERVYDGDTITRALIRVWPGIEIATAVRVIGIDTPEIRGGCESSKAKARAARDFAIQFLEDADRITIRDPIHGRYAGRVVAEVLADGVSLGTALVDAGHAVAYDGQTARPDWCVVSETEKE